MSSEKLAAFLAWLDENNVIVHEGVSIVENDESEISVISEQDSPILHPDKRTCSLNALHHYH